MQIIPKDTRYIPFAQQKSCCVPTCISMIMYKRNIPLIPLELLGYHLGLIVAPEFKKLFWNPRTGKRPPAGYGTRIYMKQFSPNSAFKKLGIPLQMIFHGIEDFKTEKEFIDFVVKAVKEDKDILVCFDHSFLNTKKSGGGHVCVVDRIYPRKKIIRLIDPSTNQPKWREVKISDLKKATDVHFGKSGGFWEFVKK